MNTKDLRKIADGAVAYGKKWGGNRHQQYEHAKTYVNTMKAGSLLANEYQAVIKRIADKLEV